MNLKQLIKKCIKEAEEERASESKDAHFPLYFISGGDSKAREIHIASPKDIRELFNFVGDGVDEIDYEDGDLIITFWQDTHGNISWKDYARLDEYMKEISTYYSDQSIPEVITGWDINTTFRRLKISFSEDDYEVYLY